MLCFTENSDEVYIGGTTHARHCPAPPTLGKVPLVISLSSPRDELSGPSQEILLKVKHSLTRSGSFSISTSYGGVGRDSKADFRG